MSEPVGTSRTETTKASEKIAPYCPAATLLMIVRYYRKQDVPPAISKEKLLQLGVTDALVNRTWQALVFFGFIDKDGKTGDTLTSIRYATDENYPTVLGAILQSAYADIFSVIGDPATATEGRLNAAFTPYSPGGQRDRMKLLFVGLCQEAGIPLAVGRIQRSTQADVGAAQRSSSKAPRTGLKPKAPVSRSKQVSKITRREATGDDAPLTAWFDMRPPVGSVWPTAARERWNTTLMAIIAGMYDEVSADAWTTDDIEDEGDKE